MIYQPSYVFIITCCNFVMAAMALVSVDKDDISDNTAVNVAIWARSSTSVSRCLGLCRMSFLLVLAYKYIIY